MMNVWYLIWYSSNIFRITHARTICIRIKKLWYVMTRKKLLSSTSSMISSIPKFIVCMCIITPLNFYMCVYEYMINAFKEDSFTHTNFVHKHVVYSYVSYWMNEHSVCQCSMHLKSYKMRLLMRASMKQEPDIPLGTMHEYLTR